MEGWSVGTIYRTGNYSLMSYRTPDDEGFEPVMIGSNPIREANEALFPDGRNLIGLLMKGRLNPVVKPQADHILSMAIRRGKLDRALGLNGKELNAAEALYVADVINSYGTNGLSRDEMLEAFSALPTMERRPRNNANGAAGGFGQ